MSEQKTVTNENINIMKKNTFILAGAMALMASPALGAMPHGAPVSGDGDTPQQLTVDGKTVNRTVSEIRLDGNNAVLRFTDGGTLEVDMQTVCITLNYDDATGISTLRLNGRNGDVKVYDLKGRRVSESQVENKSLSDGVYIVDGKKVNYKKK